MTTEYQVGRPVGKAKKTSDAEAIRKVFNQYGPLYPTAKVVKVLEGRNKLRKNGEKVETDTVSLAVKISQVRSVLIFELTGMKREGRGRWSKEQVAKIAAALAKKAPKVEPKAA
jgi:hypothetical protein